MTPDQIPPYAEGICDDCGHAIECREDHDCREFTCPECDARTFPLDHTEDEETCWCKEATDV